jgi:predicted ATP-dependent serine protease
MFQLQYYNKWLNEESNKETNKIDVIKSILNIKTNFKLCKRCAKQLHHGITRCTRCGEMNSNVTNSTVGNLLYTTKHRDYVNKYPAVFTPELIYDTYQERFNHNNISKEEFIDYINNESF